jgi:hypothetical protein
MPFVDYTTEDELKKKQEQGQQTAPTTMQSTALQSGQNTQASAGGNKGSGWTNIQTYLNNNAGQGAQTTQNILDSKQGQIKDAVDSLNKEADATKTKVNQGTVQRNTTLENQVKTSPTAIDKNAYNSYVNQSYGGPNVYAPSVDTEKKWNGLQTQTTLQQVADPKTIGQQLKKSNYTYGLGKLDSYLVGAEGGDKVSEFNTANKGVLDDRNRAIQGVNDQIKTAQSSSAESIKSLRDATSQAYNDWYSKAQATVNPSKDAAYSKAKADIQAKLDAAGIASQGASVAPSYISDQQGYGWQDSVDDSTLQALNTLADLDSDPNTNIMAKGTNNPYSVNWSALDAYINANRPKQPVTTTDTVASGAPGDKIGRDFATTTYPDGSYDVKGPDGEVISYNADGTVKNTSGTNIFT